MRIHINGLLYAFSEALDAVEGAVLGATTYHGQRVAYMATLMATKLAMGDKDKLALAVASVMHDNALTQNVRLESKDEWEEAVSFGIEKNLGKHCALGEHNVKILPIYGNMEGAILYHHERADGSGPFGKTAEETPLMARVIHIADRADIRMDFSNVTREKYNELIDLLEESKGSIYDADIVELFKSAVTFEALEKISGKNVTAALFETVPNLEKDYTGDELIQLSNMFARIIDFKSPFTTRHSMGIAEKAMMMGKYYGWDEETCDKLYFAGAVHDLGKLIVDDELLEKPGKLTSEEFERIKDHAAASYVILKSVEGLEDVADWAALHHEKLDGTGYPFGRTGAELNEKERLMGCLDIYQALVESRPYKEGMSHEKTMGILYSMVEQGKIDGRITKDIDDCFKDWVEPKAE